MLYFEARKGEPTLTIGTLTIYGADTKEGLQRCMNNESFYLRLVKMYRETPIFKACMMRLRQVISPLPLKRRMH